MSTGIDEIAKQPERELIITRIFDAPRELVFNAWTEPEHVMQWWGPRCFTCPSCEIDLRPGGTFQFCMCSPDGHEYWVKGEYHEIIVPEKIVSSVSFSDAEGNVVEPSYYGMGPNVPSKMLDIVKFEVHNLNQTKFTLHRNTPLSISKSYQEDVGWNQSLDKFAETIAELQTRLRDNPNNRSMI